MDLKKGGTSVSSFFYVKYIYFLHNILIERNDAMDVYWKAFMKSVKMSNEYKEHYEKMYNAVAVKTSVKGELSYLCSCLMVLYMHKENSVLLDIKVNFVYKYFLMDELRETLEFLDSFVLIHLLSE